MGPYDNDAGRYVESSDWENGQWLMDGDGALYIVPIGGDGIEGPEGEVSDRILAVLRDGHGDILTDAQLDDLDLLEVSSTLRRFSPENGYYSA